MTTIGPLASTSTDGGPAADGVGLSGVSEDTIPVPHSGAAVIRLRTKDCVLPRGHALLIGSPFDELGEVAACLRRMASWLAPRYELAEGPVDASKAIIEAQVERLRQSVRPGDQVLLYYAGHGMQGLPNTELFDQPVALLLPMDARDATPALSRLIPGYELTAWLAGLAVACKVPPSDTSRRDKAAPEPSVTIVLECCHAAGVMGAWPVSEVDRTTIVEDQGRRLLGNNRGAPGALGNVVRVMAAGRDEIAQGPTSRDVGLMTQALVELLKRHTDEPWWALMDRLQMAWKEPTQHPELAGPDTLIPLSGRRLERPDGLWPCRRIDETWWECPLAGPAGWKPGEDVTLIGSLSAAHQAKGQVAYDTSGALRIRVTRMSGEGLADRDFAWVTRPAPGRKAVVEIWGGDSQLRRNFAGRLAGHTRSVDDLGSEAPLAAKEARRRNGRDPVTVRVELTGDAVVLRDRGGDEVARTTPEDLETASAWIDRLAALDDWLDLAGNPTIWPDDAFHLRWGAWRDERRLDKIDAPEILHPGTLLWVELEAGVTFVPAYVSLFRIRADKVVQALTEQAAHGLPATGRYPVAGIGDGVAPLQFHWPQGLKDNGPRWEQLVAMVSDVPLPLSLLGKGPVRGRPTPETRTRSGTPRKSRVAVLVRRYKLQRCSSGQNVQ